VMLSAWLIACHLAAAAQLEERIVSEDITFASATSLRLLVDESKRNLAAGLYAAAEAKAAQAEAEAEKSPLDEARRVLADAVEVRARALVKLKRADEARGEIARLLSLEPARQTAKEPRDAFVKLVETIRAEVVGTLAVSSTPADAAVYVDGQMLGVTPLAATAVVAGKHHLTVERAGFAAAAEEITVMPDQLLEQQVMLDRQGSTLLVLTDAPGIRVDVDGVRRGESAVPTRDEVDLLARRSGRPIDTAAPPPLIVLSPLTPGRHELSFSAPCRRTRTMAYDIDEARDLVEIVSLERLSGGLSVSVLVPGRAAADVGAGEDGGYHVLIDGVERGRVAVPPGGHQETEDLNLNGLCPGAHELRVVSDAGDEARRTVDVVERHRRGIKLAFLPTLALLPAEPALAAAREALSTTLAAASGFNLLLPATDVPVTSLEKDGVVDGAVRDLLADGTGAQILAWLERGGDGRPWLKLLARGSSVAETRVVDTSAAREALFAELEFLPPRATSSLGLVAVPDTRGGLLVAALRPGGAALAAGVKVGDRLLRVAESALGPPSLAAAEAALHPGEAVKLQLTRGGETLNLEVIPEPARREWRSEGRALLRNALLARLDTELALGTTGDAAGDMLERAKLQFELGDIDAALLAAAAADLKEPWGVGLGTALYWRGRLAHAARRDDEARAALGEALKIPQARGLEPMGPRLQPLIEETLRGLGP